MNPTAEGRTKGLSSGFPAARPGTQRAPREPWEGPKTKMGPTSQPSLFSSGPERAFSRTRSEKTLYGQRNLKPLSERLRTQALPLLRGPSRGLAR